MQTLAKHVKKFVIQKFGLSEYKQYGWAYRVIGPFYIEVWGVTKSWKKGFQISWIGF